MTHVKSPTAEATPRSQKTEVSTCFDDVQLPGARGATRHGKPQFGDESLCHATWDAPRHLSKKIGSFGPMVAFLVFLWRDCLNVCVFVFFGI